MAKKFLVKEIGVKVDDADIVAVQFAYLEKRENLSPFSSNSKITLQNQMLCGTDLQ